MRRYHISAPSLPVPALGVLSALLAIAAIVFGGATREGELLNAGVRILALVVLLLAVFQLSRFDPRTEWRRPLILAAAIALLPLLQLVPLPPLIWSHLPGRGEIAALYDAAGMPVPWHGLGLDPEGGLNAAFALLPGLAMFMVGLSLNTRSRLQVAIVAAIFAFAGTLLGIAQVADGRESLLRLYETTNASAAVGFFSNRNHQASLQLVAMPLVAVICLAWTRRAPWRRAAAMVMGAGLMMTLAVATALSESRAGMVLYLPVVAACVLMAVRDRLPRWSARAVLLALASAVLVVGLVAGGALWSRPDIVDALASDARLRALPVIATEAFRNLPFGTGLGTFDEIYRSREAVESLSNAYLNHAHNDYLEVALETGLPGLALVVLFLAWFARRGGDAWARRGVDGDLACAGAIIVATLALHSLVDYPLRTGALSALFGFACALMLPYAGQVPDRSSAALPEAPGQPRGERLPRGTRTRAWIPGRDR